VYVDFRTIAANEVQYIDAVLAVRSATVPAYFDGDTDACAWTGTAHASTSKKYSGTPLNDYVFDSGAGTLAAASGQLVPSSIAEKKLYHSARGYTYSDVQVTVKAMTGATFGPDDSVALIVKHLDANNYLWVSWHGSGIVRIAKQDAGAGAGLASVGYAPTTNVTRWLRGRIEGNVITVEIFSNVPTPLTAPDATVSYTLTGADATKFGAGIAGYAGLRFISAPIDWRYDDFTVEPFTYRNQTLPQAMRLGGTIPGSAPALADVSLTTTAAQAWALLSWTTRNLLYNRVLNGDFEDDIDGWTGAVGPYSAGSTITRVTSAFKYGTASMQIATAGGTANQGAFARIYDQPFKKGVVYTFEAWVRAAAGTQPIEAVLVSTAVLDFALSNTANLSTTQQRVTGTWAPTADRTDVQVILRVTSTVAQTFTVDAVMVYEGTTAPTAYPQAEGRGADPPFGIIEAEASDASDNLVFAITADAAAQSGQKMSAAMINAVTAQLLFYLDPSLVPPDAFAGTELRVEAWARINYAATMTSLTAITSARSALGASFGTPRFTEENGSAGKLLSVQAPAAGQWRIVKLGTLTLISDPLNPQRWKLQVQFTTVAGSTGNLDVDYLFLAPVRQRAAGPTSKPNDSTYPKFITSASETTKTIKSDGSAVIAKPGTPTYPDHGLGGQLLELPPGQVDLFVELSNLVPDDPTIDTTTETLGPAATVHAAITPRHFLGRGN